MSFNGSSYTFPFPVLLLDGTAAAPSLSFASGPTNGMYLALPNLPAFASGGAPIFGYTNNTAAGLALQPTMPLSWASSAAWGSPDVLLYRDAANTLALRNGTAAQQFNVGPAGNLISLIGSVAGAASYIEGIEGTAPAAGAANTGRIFFQDNGGGKTQLMVIFNSGAAQQIALQP